MSVPWLSIGTHQLPGLGFLLGLLSPEGDLGGHDPLPLRDEGALGAQTVAPSAVALVPLQGRHDAMVATPVVHIIKLGTIVSYDYSGL